MINSDLLQKFKNDVHLKGLYVGFSEVLKQHENRIDMLDEISDLQNDVDNYLKESFNTETFNFEMSAQSFLDFIFSD
ncbi:MAG: hypothetical protein L3J35_03605 [Bacteroidales bacterium]|nr:hypothetical protein [Bacteroidales bacterium]